MKTKKHHKNTTQNRSPGKVQRESTQQPLISTRARPSTAIRVSSAPWGSLCGLVRMLAVRLYTYYTLHVLHWFAFKHSIKSAATAVPDSLCSSASRLTCIGQAIHDLYHVLLILNGTTHLSRALLHLKKRIALSATPRGDALFASENPTPQPGKMQLYSPVVFPIRWNHYFNAIGALCDGLCARN